MRTRMYGGVRGRKTKVGGKPTFVFLLLDFFEGKTSLNRNRCYKNHGICVASLLLMLYLCKKADYDKGMHKGYGLDSGDGKVDSGGSGKVL